MIQIIPVEGLKLIKQGDRLGLEIVKALRARGFSLLDGDVVVVSHVVVAKSEGRVFRLSMINPSPQAVGLAQLTGKDPAHVDLILRESRRIVRVRGEVIISETRHGIICANSGVDLSNVGEGLAAALPEDPDASARRIRSEIEEASGVRVGVIVCDSHGRPFRRGAVNVAIGCSGLEPIWDRRGEPDLYGRILRSKQICVADELASAAELVMGQAAEGVPAAVIRGYKFRPGETGASQIIRPRSESLF
ncbi:MAG: coenzyme F420-0:L-glutamate ligase [Nitrososphaerota archaeon]|nr:coenzyme F420-0:L-glutamate ligase [Candidatus Calditenuaceae archaeon]MDW8072810.1 coenzyme F420-0:L-glutamate ligase [Nitrososphaerota archaeon]